MITKYRNCINFTLDPIYLTVKVEIFFRSLNMTFLFWLFFSQQLRNLQVDNIFKMFLNFAQILNRSFYFSPVKYPNPNPWKSVNTGGCSKQFSALRFPILLFLICNLSSCFPFGSKWEGGVETWQRSFVREIGSLFNKIIEILMNIWWIGLQNARFSICFQREK